MGDVKPDGFNVVAAGGRMARPNLNEGMRPLLTQEFVTERDRTEHDIARHRCDPGDAGVDGERAIIVGFDPPLREDVKRAIAPFDLQVCRIDLRSLSVVGIAALD